MVELKREEKKEEWSKTMTLETVSRDLLVEILARVGSSSFTYLYNAKWCCKDFLEAAEDDYIFECISLDKISRHRYYWPVDDAGLFMQKCFNIATVFYLFESWIRKLKKGIWERTYWGYHCLWHAAPFSRRWMKTKGIEAFEFNEGFTIKMFGYDRLQRENQKIY